MKYFAPSDLIGLKVICRPNDNAGKWEPFMVATFKGWAEPHNIPIVTDENGKDWLQMGIIVPFSDALAECLSKLTPPEQYELLVGIRQLWAVNNNQAELARKAKEPALQVEHRDDHNPIKRKWWRGGSRW